jgi:hypothetical protein
MVFVMHVNESLFVVKDEAERVNDVIVHLLKSGGDVKLQPCRTRSENRI